MTLARKTTLTITDLNDRVRGREALLRLRRMVEEGAGADLAALVARLEDISPRPEKRP